MTSDICSGNTFFPKEDEQTRNHGALANDAKLESRSSKISKQWQPCNIGAKCTERSTCERSNRLVGDEICGRDRGSCGRKGVAGTLVLHSCWKYRMKTELRSIMQSQQVRRLIVTRRHNWHSSVPKFCSTLNGKNRC